MQGLGPGAPPTPDRRDASRVTQLTVGELSLNSVTRFLRRVGHTPSMTNHSRSSPTISKLEFVIPPLGLQTRLGFVWCQRAIPSRKQRVYIGSVPQTQLRQPHGQMHPLSQCNQANQRPALDTLLVLWSIHGGEFNTPQVP